MALCSSFPQCWSTGVKVAWERGPASKPEWFQSSLSSCEPKLGKFPTVVSLMQRPGTVSLEKLSSYLGHDLQSRVDKGV